jgi:hypothetical protein
MTELIATLSAVGIALLGIFLTSQANRRNDARRRYLELASVAFVDLMGSLAENAEALRLIADGENEELSGEGRKRLTASRALYLSAKARLVSYGDADVVNALATFETNPIGSDPTSQQAILAAIGSIRRGAGLQPLDDGEVRRILFGSDGVASPETASTYRSVEHRETS